MVRGWVGQLRDSDKSPRLGQILDVALKMMERWPSDWPYMWEAEMDLNEILSLDDQSIPKLKKASLCVQRSRHERPHGRHFTRRSSQASQPNWETPLHRAANQGNRIRVARLWELGWPIFQQDRKENTPLSILQGSKDPFLRDLKTV